MNKINVCGMCGKNYINPDDDICLSCAESDDSIADSIDEYLELEELEVLEDLKYKKTWLNVTLSKDTELKNNINNEHLSTNEVKNEFLEMILKNKENKKDRIVVRTYTTDSGRKIHNCPMLESEYGYWHDGEKYVFSSKVFARIYTLEEIMKEKELQEISYSDYY